MLEPLEPQLRSEDLDPETDLVVRLAPHYSIVLAAYSEAEALRLIEALGEVHPNPCYVGRRR